MTLKTTGILAIAVTVTASAISLLGMFLAAAMAVKALGLICFVVNMVCVAINVRRFIENEQLGLHR